MITVPINPLALIGVDCPACQSYWYCEDGCVCPVCWPDRFATNQDDSLRQWFAFAPALAHMNTEGIKWDWCTSHAKPTVHSVEISIGDASLVEVFALNGQFHGEYCEYDKRDNFWNVKYTASFVHPHEITDWVNKFR